MWRVALMLLAAEPALAGTVTISPTYAQLQPGQTLSFTASPAGGVIWQVDNATGVGISPQGVYTAPQTPPSPAVATITAVSAADPSQSATATVTLLSAPLAGTTYYVATNGNDSNPGTLAAPFATIQHAAGVAKPGDTVLVRGGVYNKLVTLTASGTAAAPITFASYPGETATIDGTGLAIPGGQNGLITMNSVGDVIIEGFEVRNYTTAKLSQVPIGIYITGAGDGVQVVNNHIHNITTTAKTNPNQCGSDAFGMTVYGTKAPAAITNLVVSGNEIDHLLTGCSETFSVDGNVDGFAVLSNLIHDDNNIAIGAIGFEKVSPNPKYDQARNGYVRGNLIYNITSYGNPDYGKQYAADGIYVDGGTQIVIEQNTVHNTDLGIEMASEHHLHVSSYVIARNNLSYSNNANGISIGGYDNGVGGSDHITIVNNTLWNNDTKKTGSGEFQIQFHATNNIFENNIVYAGPQGLLVNNFTDSEPDPATLDHNLYYFPPGASKAHFVWEHTNYNGYAPYLKGSGQDAQSAFANPLFVNLTGPDLDVQSGSPAIGAGAFLAQDIIGAYDYAGNPRVGANNSVTLGAYQQPGSQ
jgi:hypothetical protein